MDSNRVEVIDGQVTVSGIMIILNVAGVRTSRRNVHYFIKNQNYPTKMLGTVLLVPQRVVPDFIAAWHSRHSS